MRWKNLICAGVLSLAVGVSATAFAQETNQDVKDQKNAVKQQDKAA